MIAKELLEKYIKKEVREDVGVIAIFRKKQNQEMDWYHVHENEQIPNKDHDIAIHLRL